LELKKSIGSASFSFFKPAMARLEAAPGNNWPNQDPIIRTIIADPV
jgi:hypothetical protein